MHDPPDSPLVPALTWNLFHGRDHPPDAALLTRRSRLLRLTETGETHAQVNHSLFMEFARVLTAGDWRVAMLQEAPPRWLEPLCRRCGASGALALTSRNFLPHVRTTLARLNPDLIASNEGGSNMVLVRAPWRVEDTERFVLATRPERRTLLLARAVDPSGRRVALACMHLSVPSTGQGHAEVVKAAEHAQAFANGEPLIFGGDLNLRPRQHAATFDEVRERFGLAAPTAPRAIDHLLCAGLDTVEPPHALPDSEREAEGPDGLRIRLSDHPPVAAVFSMR